MKIAIVCRLNQARSIVGAAVLRKFIPSATIMSAGTHAETGNEIPTQIQLILKKWGLNLVEEHSTSVKELDFQTFDFILAADSSVKKELENQSLNGQIINLQDIGFEKELIPFDPLGMRSDLMEVELSKIALAVRKFVATIKINDSKFDVVSCIPRSIESEVLNLTFAEDYARNGKTVILDLNLRAPEASQWDRSGLRVHKLGRNFISELKSTAKSYFSESCVISSLYEAAYPEAAWLSLELNQIIEEISSKNTVLIVTAPLMYRDFHRPDAYLSSLNSTKIVIN